MTQWGHSPTEVPDDNDDIIAKAQIGADEIKRFNGSTFVVGSSSQLLCKLKKIKFLNFLFYRNF